MNRRLKKKRRKMIDERYKFIRSYMVSSGMTDDKTNMFRSIREALLSWQYAPFKKIKRIYTKKF